MRLVQGSVPVTHPTDYVNEGDAKKLKVSRPSLKAVRSNPNLTLCVNVLLDGTTSKQTIKMLTEICSQHHYIKVMVKGINLFGLNPVAAKLLQKHFSAFISPTTDHIYVSESCFQYLSKWKEICAVASDDSLSLWFYRDIKRSQYIPILPALCRNLLLHVCTHTPTDILSHTLAQLTEEPCRLQSFCLIQSNAVSSRILSSALSAFLAGTCECLEYLQLQSWRFTFIPLDSIVQCSKLRVLCITQTQADFRGNVTAVGSFRPINSVENVLEAVSQLPYLEFFQWSEVLNFTTTGLLCLCNVLTDSFSSLHHFHLCFNYMLLSTTDLENETFSVLNTVLLPLLSGKEGSEEVTTFRYALDGIVDVVLDWLVTVRPGVCFKFDTQLPWATQLEDVLDIDRLFIKHV